MLNVAIQRLNMYNLLFLIRNFGYKITVFLQYYQDDVMILWHFF